MAIVIPAGPQPTVDMGSAAFEAGRGAAAVDARREGHAELRQALAGLTDTTARGLLEVFRMQEERDRYQQESAFRQQQFEAQQRQHQANREANFALEEMRQSGRRDLTQLSHQLQMEREVERDTRQLENLMRFMPVDEHLAARQSTLNHELFALEEAREEGQLDEDEYLTARAGIERRQTEVQGRIDAKQAAEMERNSRYVDALMPLAATVYGVDIDDPEKSSALRFALMSQMVSPESSAVAQSMLGELARQKHSQTQQPESEEYSMPITPDDALENGLRDYRSQLGMATRNLDDAVGEVSKAREALRNHLDESEAPDPGVTRRLMNNVEAAKRAAELAEQRTSPMYYINKHYELMEMVNASRAAEELGEDRTSATRRFLNMVLEPSGQDVSGETQPESAQRDGRARDVAPQEEGPPHSDRMLRAFQVIQSPELATEQDIESLAADLTPNPNDPEDLDVKTRELNQIMGIAASSLPESRRKSINRVFRDIGQRVRAGEITPEEAIQRTITTINLHTRGRQQNGSDD